MAFVYFAEALVLARELKRRGITRLHNHFANAGAIVGYLAAGLLDMPWSFTMHGISETDYPAGLLLAKKIAGGGFRGLRILFWAGAGDAPRFTRPLGQAARRALRLTAGHAAEGIRLSARETASSVSAGFRRKRVRPGLLEAFATHRRKLTLCRIGLRWRRSRSGGSTLKVRTAWDCRKSHFHGTPWRARDARADRFFRHPGPAQLHGRPCPSSSWKQWR